MTERNEGYSISLAFQYEIRIFATRQCVIHMQSTDNCEHMTPAQFIREQVFGEPSQESFAKALKYSQANISRWETGVQPIAESAQRRIRALAKARKIDFDANWFFEVPRGGPRRAA